MSRAHVVKGAEGRTPTLTPPPPLSPLPSPPSQRVPKDDMVGQLLPVKFLEVDQERTRLVLSNKVRGPSVIGGR